MFDFIRDRLNAVS